MTEEERISKLEKKTKQLELVAVLHTLTLVLGAVGITTILVDELKGFFKK
jgi:type IV secretory pathway component VirB8